MTEKYFKSLNYSLANEDTWPEVRIVQKIKPKKILSVAGSGGRALPLLASNPEELICIDLSQEQLGLVNLRQESIKKLTLDEFLLFWGYPPYNIEKYRTKRKEIFGSFHLKDEEKAYFENLFSELQWDSILYSGKWEKTFRLFSNVPRLLIGNKTFDKLREFSDLESQKKYIQTNFPHLRWKMVLKILGNATVFNALLYKGHFVEKNTPGTHYDYYLNAFKRIFSQTLIKDNFFAQLCFFGEIISPEAIPVEGHKENFEAMKDWLLKNHSAKLMMGDILRLIANDSSIKDIDYLSFSDVPSYFRGDIEIDFLQTVRPKLAPGGVVVVRNYLRMPEGTNVSGYKDVTEEYIHEFFDEKVQMYMIKVYQKS